MSFVAAAVVAGATLVTTQMNKRAQQKAARQAKKDQLEAEKQARKAEVFAETEGEGVGSLGQVSLEVDEDLEEEEEVGTNVSI